MAIAEQMGVTLANTAYSVNIKERLDFSCALFDADGNLIANAPHMPVHLGSMGESVQTIIDRRAGTMQPRRRVRAERAVQRRHAPARRHGDRAGVPADDADKASAPTAREPEFYVASRGHHADIGGITPGSMPPDSTHVDEEGVLLDNVQLVARRPLPRSGDARDPRRRAAIRRATSSRTSPICARRSPPARRAPPSSRRWSRTSACRSCAPTCSHVQDNAEEAVRRVLGALTDGHFEYEMDSGAIDSRRDHASTARSARRRSTSPARARSSRPTSTRRRRCARRRCCTCSARSSTTRSR